MVDPRQRLEALERLLQDPPADGLMVMDAPTDGGLLPGDLLRFCDGLALTTKEGLMQVLQAAKQAGRPASLALLRQGRSLEVAWPAGLTGIDSCVVRAGISAWPDHPDHDETPDFSAFAQSAEWWMRNSFEEQPAGFEMIRIQPEVDGFCVDEIFRLGGGEGTEQWEYHTRMSSRHRRDRWLSQTDTAFWSGAPGAEQQKGNCRLEPDGRWRGIWHGGKNGVKQIDAPGDLPLLSSYATPLLALTLPLRAGEQITTTFCYDGHPVPESRTRLVMEPQRSIRVFGREHLAWPVRWRHYGSGDDPSEDECFYIDAGRRLLRLDWGPRYGNCVTEICDRATALAGLPAAVSRSLPWG